MRSIEILLTQRMIAVFICLLLPLLSVGCVKNSGGDADPKTGVPASPIGEAYTAKEETEKDIVK